jgi:dihydroxyacetone kinase-like predicted kinase
MDNQVSHDSAKYEPNQTVSLLAITQDYFDYIFKESGCTETISIRPGNTLTVSSMLSTITDSINSDLIIIPNNIAHDPITRLFDNALINGKTLRVLEANSLVHGLAALLAYNPFISLENNLASMRTALARTVSLAISLKTGTNCSRDTTTPTDIFVLSIDGTEIDFDTNISSLLQRIIMTHSTGKSPILTLFSGKHVCEEEATALVATLHSFAPNLSIELLSGGQEQPCYLASLE